MWKWIGDNAVALGLVVPILISFWKFWEYLNIKHREMQSERFQVYHDLIKRLVEPEEKNGSMKLDRQLAVVFELRRFSEYYEPSLRILTGLRKSWGQSPHEEKVDERPNMQRLFDEMDDTISTMKSRSRRWRYRVLGIGRG